MCASAPPSDCGACRYGIEWSTRLTPLALAVKFRRPQEPRLAPECKRARSTPVSERSERPRREPGTLGRDCWLLDYLAVVVGESHLETDEVACLSSPPVPLDESVDV